MARIASTNQTVGKNYRSNYDKIDWTKNTEHTVTIDTPPELGAYLQCLECGKYNIPLGESGRSVPLCDNCNKIKGSE